MKTHTILPIAALITLLLIMTGCSPSLAIKVTPEATLTMSFTTGTGTELSRTFTSLTGQQIAGIQTEPARKSLAAAGLTATDISQQGSQFTLSTGPDPADTVLPGLPGALTLKKERSGSSLSFSLSPETAQYIVTLLPEDTASYTELFMAPLFTGEVMSSDEYLELIGAVYGQQLADETATSMFRMNITTPGKITGVSLPKALNATHVTNGSTTIISIPLSSLLTISEPHSILVFFDETLYTN